MNKLSVVASLYNTTLRDEIDFYLLPESEKYNSRVLTKLANNQKPSDFVSPILNALSGYPHDYSNLKKMVKDQLREDYEEILLLRNKIINMLDLEV